MNTLNTRRYRVSPWAAACEYAELFGGAPDDYVNEFAMRIDESTPISEADLADLYDTNSISAGEHDAILFALEEATGNAGWRI